MEVYIQSRGKNQEHDYRWLKITQDNMQEAIVENERLLINPPVVDEVIALIPTIEQSSVAVILAKYEKCVIILVYGLDSERKDFRDRKISNDVAWVGQVSDDKDKNPLGNIADALQSWDSMKAVIQESVKQSEGEYGFKVIGKNLYNIHEQLNPKENKPGQQEIYLIKEKSDSKLRPVPKEEFFQDYLSTLSPPQPTPEKKKKLMIAVSIIIVLLAILGAWWLMSQPQESPQKIPIPQILINPQLETQPTPIQTNTQIKT